MSRSAIRTNDTPHIAGRLPPTHKPFRHGWGSPAQLASMGRFDEALTLYRGMIDQQPAVGPALRGS